MKRHRRLFRTSGLPGLIAAGLLTSSSLASAQPADEFCPLYEEISNTQLLRRLSLDLRRQLPSYEEYETLGDEPVDDALIDDYLNGPEFAAAVRRFHDDLLWSNVGNVRLSNNKARLSAGQIGGITTLVSQSGARRNTHRGDADLFCADYPQTEWCTISDMQNATPGCDGVGLPKKDANGQDGWVLVTPYWDPPTCTVGPQCQSGACQAGSCAPVRACAFDAQEAEAWTVDGSPPDDNDDCNFVSGMGLQGCGCGPDMRFCWGPGVENTVRASVNEQLHQLVEAATMGDLSYSEMLTTQRTYYDGRLFFWKRYLAQMATFNETFDFHFKGDVPLPNNIDYHDTAWAPYQRSEVHSGIMTLAAFTLRFQTNRGRANRFRSVFIGKYFEPPADIDKDCDPNTSDLTQQCTCRHCHATLEPLAAYFGNIAEAGSALISDRNFFPEYLPCDKPGQLAGIEKALCSRFYANDAAEPNVGALLPLQFAGDDSEVHKQIGANFDAGPAAWAQQIIGDGTFARTSVINLWRHLMKRDMNLDPLSPDNELALLETLTGELRNHDNFKQIVKRIVTLDSYRRMR